MKASTLQMWPCRDWVGVTLHTTYLLEPMTVVAQLLLQSLNSITTSALHGVTQAAHNGFAQEFIGMSCLAVNCLA